MQIILGDYADTLHNLEQENKGLKEDRKRLRKALKWIAQVPEWVPLTSLNGEHAKMFIERAQKALESGND